MTALSSRPRLLAAGLCALALLLGVRSARADEPAAETSTDERVNGLRTEGAACYRKRDYRCALTRFEQAYALKPSAALRFNVASAEDKLGLAALSVRHYQLFLKEAGPSAPAAALAHIARRLKLLHRRVGRVALRILPPGAHVLVNGMPLEAPLAPTPTPAPAPKSGGPAELELVLDPGTHKIEVAEPGWLAKTLVVTLAPGEARSELVSLERNPKATGPTSRPAHASAPPLATPPPHGAPPSALPSPTLPPPSSGAPSPKARRVFGGLVGRSLDRAPTDSAFAPAGPPDPALVARRRRKNLWAGLAFATSAAAAAGMTVLYAIGKHDGDSAYADYRAATREADRQRYGDEVTGAQGKLIGGHVLLGVSVAALGLAIYELATRPRLAERPKAPPPPVQITPAPGPVPQIQIQGAF
ncbi:MAG: hypothetical protein IT371_04610 [Deltaproteobacteria bacterium]|nr:hypothetical protein [Deltaproteobacteria bacterium]